MKTLKAIISTILLVLIPLIMIPTLQWYKKTFLEPNTDLFAINVLLVFVSAGMFIITIINWICAFQDKTWKELFNN